MIKCLIVDDEPIARMSLESMIEKFEVDGFKIVGLAANIDEAYQLILDLTPDVIFLDINMPGDSGFKLLDRFDKVPFKTVFVTAYSEFAIKAVKADAFDYLLKPVDEMELEFTIEKIKKRNSFSDDEIAISNRIAKNLYTMFHEKQSTNRIMIPHSKGVRFATPDEIIRLHGDYGYTTFFFLDKTTLMVSKNFKELADLLTDDVFLRVHKSHIVNTNYVKEYISKDGGHFEMIDKSVVPVVKKKVESFLKKRL